MELEIRLEERKGSNIARNCLEEMKEKSRRGRISLEWREERKESFANRRLEVEEIKEVQKRGDRENVWFKEMEERDQEKKKRGR